MHPLPARQTGRSGIETNALDHSEDAFDTRSVANSSADLVHPAPAPYSMPSPLGQEVGAHPYAVGDGSYYDDPSGAYSGAAPSSAYYDPYRGPVPSTLSPSRPESGAFSGQQQQGGVYDDAQLGYDAGRSTSPGPQAAYGGRTSPGPQAAYGGRTSPGPQAAYGGRTSPGPQAAYGGRMSPGPQEAYGGRMSPGPQEAYGGRMSPGPQEAYRGSQAPQPAYGGQAAFGGYR
jgi:hypothetical protein